MKIAVAAFVLVALLLPPASGEAQTPTRVRGTIASLNEDTLSVNARDGRHVAVQVTDKTSIVFTQPIQLTDLKNGDFLGVTSVKRSDGTLNAYEIRRFPKPVNPGHRPLDGRDDQTMTNAALSATVQSSNGRELMLSYDGGAQKVIVAPNAIVSTLVPGNRSQLVSDAPVSLVAETAADGKLIARSIQVSPPGFTPK